jgi:dihydropteroate synthase-like protein
LTILLVTGTLAKHIVEKYASRSKLKVEVVSLPIQVAALMSPQYISNQLKRIDLSKFDLILVPGAVRGDTAIIGREIGVPTFKGPKHAADIPFILENVEETKLSTVRPACELLGDAVMKKALMELNSIYGGVHIPRGRSRSVPIGQGPRKVWVGKNLPMRVLAEIVDASIMSDGEIGKRAQYYVQSGADIVDIGMVSGGGHPEEAKRAVKAAKSSISKPVSIDTLDPEEIGEAIKAGVDLILSLDMGNMDEVSKLSRNTPVVITPGTRKHTVPTEATQRVKQLCRNISKAKSLGFNRIIADPVLSPILMPSLTESIVAYYEFRIRNPDIPVLLGAGNVTELMDADSPGANLLLAGIGAELGASILLTTENSDKTYRSVKELSTAVKIVSLAAARGSAPKDVGLNLLVLKEKRRREDVIVDSRGAKELRANSGLEIVKDPKGLFQIALDRDRSEIMVAHFSYGSAHPDLLLRGNDPLGIVALAIEQGLVSRLDHAAYLGLELEKAKTALMLGRSYVQDSELF